MKRVFLIICILLMAYPKSYSQQLFLIVYNGNVSDGQKILKQRVTYKIAQNAKLKFEAKSNAIVYSTNKAIDINAATDQSFSTADLAAKIAKATASAGVISFVSYINKYHHSYEENQESEGKPIAGVRRLNKNEELRADGIFPADSATVIGENVRLQWNPQTTAADDELIVTNAKTEELIIRQAAPAKGSTFVKTDKEGTYNWKIYASMEDKSSIDRIFIKPNAATAKKIQDNLAAFKLQIAAMGDDMKKLLLEEYLIANNIAVN